jgi:hypothetical protein
MAKLYVVDKRNGNVTGPYVNEDAARQMATELNDFVYRNTTGRLGLGTLVTAKQEGGVLSKRGP